MSFLRLMNESGYGLFLKKCVLLLSSHCTDTVVVVRNVVTLGLGSPKSDSEVCLLSSLLQSFCLIKVNRPTLEMTDHRKTCFQLIWDITRTDQLSLSVVHACSVIIELLIM